jgi:hypothetical protein
MIAVLSFIHSEHHDTSIGCGYQDAATRKRLQAWSVYGDGGARHLKVCACPAATQ